MPAAEGALQNNQSATTVLPQPTQPLRQRGGGGRWMRRVWVRTGQVERQSRITFRDQEAARRAEEALRELPDSRDRHRDAARALSRAGQLERALEVVEAWIERDRMDAEALASKADLFGRMGRREESLRLLTGVVDLAPEDADLQRRLALAFERAGRAKRACAHRVAIAEIRQSDAEDLGAALRCERELGHQERAGWILNSIREDRVRTQAEREAGEEPTDSFRGDFLVRAEWSSGGDDIDLSLINTRGQRLSFMGGDRRVVGEASAAEGQERLGLRWTRTGRYLIEVSRTDPDDHRPISGRLRIRLLNENHTIPFTLEGDRTHLVVGSARVRRTARNVPVW
jgi:tetratricopeptide (TPR) repeat protein